MKIIFLDIDGVLNTRTTCTKSFLNHTFDAEPIRVLNEILKLTCTNIVISSTWRMGKNVQKLQNIFTKNNIIGDVVGLTPIINNNKGREEEIQKYLDDHSNITSFIIIDDDDFDLQKFHYCLIHINSDVGLEQKNIQQAVNILNNK